LLAAEIIGARPTETAFDIPSLAEDGPSNILNRGSDIIIRLSFLEQNLNDLKAHIQGNTNHWPFFWTRSFLQKRARVSSPTHAQNFK
jgi:hypothetical protein